MKSAMKRAAGGVALTMVLIRGFCGGGVFLGYLGIEGLLIEVIPKMVVVVGSS